MPTDPLSTSAAAPRPLLWPAVLVACVTLAVFAPVLRNEFVNFDDKIAIEYNPRLKPPTAESLKHYWMELEAHDEFYVPVTYSTWWLVAHAAQSRDPGTGRLTLRPWPFHAINWLAHAANALLVLLILHRLTGSRWASCLGALLFALHPLQAEPVAWASSMYSSLSALLALLAVWQYLRFSDLRPGRPARLAYTLATVSFAAALLTKPSVVIVPAMIAVIESVLRRQRLRDLLLPLGAWGVLALPVVLLARTSQHEAPVYVPDLPWRVLVAADALGFYLQKLVLPIGLAPDYGRSPRWLLAEGPILYTWVAPAALLAVAWVVRGKARWPLAGVLLFVFALLPTLGLMPFDYQRYSTVADRYAYLALLAPALALAWVLSRCPRRAVMMLAGAAIAVLAVLSVRQTLYWHDTGALFTHALQVNPRSLAAHSTFGNDYAAAGQQDKALAEFDQALAANPGDPRILYSVGNIYLAQGKPAEAAAAYRQALGQMDYHSGIHGNLGMVLAQLGHFDEAVFELNKAIQLDPRNAHAHANLGTILAARHDWAGARRQFEEALRVEPEQSAAREGLRQLESTGH